MKFECPHCMQHLECDDECAGRRIQCPSCKNPLVIPGSPVFADDSVKFTCPACGQHIECPAVHHGTMVDCPACSLKVRVPEPQPRNMAGDGMGELKQALQDQVAHAGITISEFLSQQNMEGGVQLDSSTESSSSASSVLTSEEGRKYKLGKMVAHGGMGAILDARDMNIRRNVAMKVMLDPKKASRQQVMRFIEEAQITGQLEHPGIVPIYELGVDVTGNVFYTMRFVSGVTLKDVIGKIADGDRETISSYPLDRLLTIFQKVCDAVAYAHSKRVIHRDLKPENIMIGDYGEVLVLDWGLTKVLPHGDRKKHHDQEAKGGARGAKTVVLPARPSIKDVIDSVRKDAGAEILQTLDGAIMGTLGYMSPEQAMGDNDRIDEKTDIYALGAILYNILTLRQAIKDKQIDKVIEKVVSGDFPPPASFNTGARTKDSAVAAGLPAGRGNDGFIPLLHCPGSHIPESLSAVVMKAMSPAYDSRYPNVTALQKDIEAYQAGFTTSAEQFSMWKQLRLFIKRNKAASVTAAAMGLMLFSLMGVYTWINHKTLNQLKATAPDLLSAARSYMEKQDLEKALQRISYAITLVPYRAEYHEFKGNILQAMLRLDEAVKAYEEALRLDPALRNVLQNQVLCRKILEAEGGAAKLSNTSILRLNNAMRAQGRFAEALAVIGKLGGKNRVLEQMFKDILDTTGFKYRSFEADGEGLFILDASKCGITNLASLKGVPFSGLNLSDNQASDISALSGMRLTSLNISGNPVIDLSALKGMPLKKLDAGKTAISDLLPLKGAPLAYLDVADTRITSVVPLKGMPLNCLNLGRTLVGDLSALKGMPLTQLNLEQTRVTDLQALKGMPLKSLDIKGAPVKEIDEIKDMPLTVLNMADAPVIDLSPLRGKKLVSLNLSGARLGDLWSLKEMPLESLDADNTAVSDLSPLRGMPLKHLSLARTKVKDLSPLKGMAISSLILADTQVISLAGLDDMPLKKLDLGGTGCTDLSPLKGLPLETLVLPATKTLDLIPLKSLKKLDKLEFDQVGVLLYDAFKALDKGHFALAEQEAANVISTWKDFPSMALGRQVAEMIIANRPLFEEVKNAPASFPFRAVALRGHHYLCITIPRLWDEARQYCESVGGHLATITSSDEVDLLDRFAPQFFFVGYSADGQGVAHWVTGEPFSHVISISRKGPAGYSGGFDRRVGAWRLEPKETRAPFVIEWDQ